MRKSRAVNWLPLSVPSTSRQRWHVAGEQSPLDAGDRFVQAVADIDGPAGNLAGAAINDGVEIDPAVRCGPDLGHVHVPQPVRAGHPEVAGPAPPVEPTDGLQQSMLARHPLHTFAVHRLTELTCGERSDHPRAVGRVGSATSTIPASPGRPRPGPAAAGRAAIGR